MRIFGGGNGQVTIRNLALREIIYRAYQTQDYLVVGGPDWMAEDRFDIVGKTPPPTTPPVSPLLMVRNLLADRFKLVMHRETRDMPVYNLVLARPDGRGTQPKPTTCVQAALGTPPERDAQGRFPCGVNRVGPGNIQLTGSNLNSLANRLGSLPAVGRTVINRTGLEGTFDFDLTFTPGLEASPSADGVSVFTALEEQVGVRLESARGRVEVLVIDSVEKPQP